MIKIAIVAGSTRPNRRAGLVAAWALDIARRHSAVTGGDVEVELLDLQDFDLPLLDEPLTAFFDQYTHAHTKRWASAVEPFDGFVFVTPEYNHSVPGALKNALDYLGREWANKAAGFVSYGVNGGVRAVEQLRSAVGALRMADVSTQVVLSLFTDFALEDPILPGTLQAGPHHEVSFHAMFDELVAWSGALQPLRRAEESSVLVS
jgi:NAD(P)H-dependent FMN reductase